MKTGLVRSSVLWMMLILLLVILVVTASAQGFPEGVWGPSTGPHAPESAVLWDQPVGASGFVIQSHDYEAVYDAWDVYAADDFSNTEVWTIDTISVAADFWTPSCPFTCAESLNWAIYNDAGGVPDGAPWGGGNSPVWSLPAVIPSDPRVTLAPGLSDWLTNVTLTLETPFELPPGTWWLVFYPTMGWEDCSCDAGWLVADTANGYAAVVANPGSAWGLPTFWTSIQDPSTYDRAEQDLAFSLAGPMDYDLGGRMWFDTDWDGLQDVSEPGVAGLGVGLYDNADCSGSHIDHTYADADGDYLFEGLPGGDYCMKMLAFPPDWFATYMNVGGDDTLDSDIDPILDKIANIHLTGDDLHEDIGLVAVGTISGTVYCDQNLNARYDAGEGLYVSMRLDMDEDCDLVGDLFVGSHTTSADGGYLFDAQPLGPRGDPWCYVLTVDKDYLDECDQGPLQLPAQLEVDQPGVTVDFVFHELYDLGDRVWHDADRDGIQDPGETGVSALTLRLYDDDLCLGANIATTDTSSSGDYIFTDLAAGEYCIQADFGAYDWAASPQNQGSDDTADSDADSSGYIRYIHLAGDDATQDVGLYALGTITGRVFCDADLDTFWDAGEERAGVTLSLYDDDGCDQSADGWLSDVDTSSQGLYGFYQLPAGPAGNPTCYVVEVDSADMGSCDTPHGGITEQAVQLDANNRSVSAGFGFYQGYEVSGRVWFDSDQDGLREQTEPGVAGINVHWYGHGDCSGEPITAATTGSDGTYSFPAVAGTYCLEFADIPAGWQISPRDQGTDDTLDSDVDPATARLHPINLNADLAHVDMGLYGQGSVGDRVWCDADGDDVYDPGEGVQGVALNLYRDDTCDAWADDNLGGETTGSDGYYLFKDLEVGPAGSPTCYIVNVEVADMGDCRLPLTATEYAVSLDANAPSYLTADFGFRNALRVYLPLVVQTHPSP